MFSPQHPHPLVLEDDLVVLGVADGGIEAHGCMMAASAFLGDGRSAAG
jgi:hypothetical protein